MILFLHDINVGLNLRHLMILTVVVYILLYILQESDTLNVSSQVDLCN